jgi:aminobenzoyl-glutamate utilization protein B
MAQTSQLNSPKNSALDWIVSNEREIIGLSDLIWMYSEPALREFKSADAHCQFLRKHDFDVKLGIGGMPTAFVASYGEGDPVIATYAEYDATPGNSQKPIPYREPIVPHGPGFEDKHNMLGTSATAAAVAASRTMEEHNLKGTIKVFGTPAEKLCLGKTFLARDGFYNDLSAVVANHPWDVNTVTWLRLPNCYLAVAFQFQGLQVYGSTPWEGKSALDAVILMNVMVNYMKEHFMRPPQSVNELISVGGQCLTNIPEFSEVFYAIRTPSEQGNKKILETLGTCAEAAAKVTGCSFRMRYVGASRTGLPNLSLSSLAFKNMQDIGAPKFTEQEKEFCRQVQKNIGIEPMEEPLDETLTPPEKEAMNFPSPHATGCDDFNEFSWYAPATWIHTTQWFKSQTDAHPPSWSIASLSNSGITHKGGIFAAKIMALTIVDLLSDPRELLKARLEYEQRLKDHGGMEPCLIPDNAKPPIDIGLPEFNGRETILRYPNTGNFYSS